MYINRHISSIQRTAFSIAQRYSGSFECWKSWVQSPVPPHRQPSGSVLASSAEGPGFNLQSRTAAYQRRNTNGTSSFIVQHSPLKHGHTGSFLEIEIGLKVMDELWDRNPSKSEVFGRCGGFEKPRMTTQNRQKSNATNKIKIHTICRLIQRVVCLLRVILTGTLFETSVLY